MEDMKVDSMPGGNGNAFSASKRLYESIKVTNDKITASSLSMGDGDWMENQEKEAGGVIVFSKEVSEKSDTTSSLSMYLKVMWNVLSKVIYDSLEGKEENVGWSIGKFMEHPYTRGEDVYDESSLCVEILGANTYALTTIAKEISNFVGRKPVLVKDYSHKYIFYMK